MKLQDFETEELAAYLCGIDTGDSIGLYTAFYNRYNIDLDDFHKLLEDLRECMGLAVSPLTNNAFVGFTKPGEWIIKKPVDGPFIGSMIHWVSEGQGVPQAGNGFSKTVTKGGVPECKLVITHPDDELKIRKKEAVG